VVDVTEEVTDFGVVEATDFGVVEATDFGVVEATDFGVVEATDFGNEATKSTERNEGDLFKAW
jgi:hypothetical protein